MSVNKIINRNVVGTLMKDGTKITVSAATKTLDWERPSFVAEKAGTLVYNNIPFWREKLPKDTVEVCNRDTEHVSDSDQKSHITAVCINSKQQGTTVHIPITKPTPKDDDKNEGGK